METAIIVDDHTVIAAGLNNYFKTVEGPQIIFTAKSEQEALDFVQKPEFNAEKTVAIVDLNLAGGYTFNLITKLKKCGLHCIVYTMYESSAFAMRSMECGASAYIFKSSDMSELLSAINAIENGKTYVPKSLEADIEKAATLTAALSAKEKIVYEYVVHGMNNLEIAKLMGISHRTIENYIVHIYDKTGAANRAELLKQIKG